VIAAHRCEGERLRRLPDAIADAFVGANGFRLLMPEDLGGAAIDPMTYFEMVEEVSFHDGSAGWNFAIATGSAVLAGSLPVKALRATLNKPADYVAGSGIPGGKAVAVDGGYRVSGRWRWGSGVHHATAAGGTAIVFDGERPRMGPNGRPVTMQFLFDKADVTVLDTWRAGGLRGTGSTDFTVTDLFVPREHAFRAFSGCAEHPAPVFRLPATFFGLGICAVALGIARQAVEGLRDLAQHKTSGPGRALKDAGQAQYAMAKAQALVDAAGLHVKATFAPIWEAAVERRPITLAMKAAARASYVHAAESAEDAVHLCCRAAGGDAVLEAAPFERALRDVHAVLGHFTVQRPIMEEAGRVMFGGEPESPFF
jgi:alkylation response protein AidB-like acyl-CoA dehydrogenase